MLIFWAWATCGWIPRNTIFHSEKLSFFRKMETEHSFELSLNICVFYRRISNLEIQNFSLENHMINARHHFVDGWHLLTKGVKPASSPPPMWLIMWLARVVWGVWVIYGLGKNFLENNNNNIYKNNNDNNNSIILGGTAAHCRSYRRSYVYNILEGEELINEHSRDFLSYKVFNWFPLSIF